MNQTLADHLLAPLFDLRLCYLEVFRKFIFKQFVYCFGWFQLQMVRENHGYNFLRLQGSKTGVALPVASLWVAAASFA